MTLPMTLAIIAEHFHPIYSGASERYRRMLPGLCVRGIEAQVFTVCYEGLALHEMLDGFPVHRLKVQQSDLHPSAELTKHTLRYFEESGEWPDVVHILSHTLQGVPYLWEMRRKGIACINSITMQPGTHARSPLDRMKYLVHQWLRYRVFDSLVVSSQTAAQAALHCGIPAWRIHVIVNGVDTQRFHPLEDLQEKVRLREKLGFSAQDTLVLFVGALSYRKGIDLLFAAWPKIRAAHPQARLVLVGPKGDLALPPESAGNGMSRWDAMSITYREPLPQIETYMQVADILVLLSRLEGMPNVVVEGMACALPCVLTPFQGLPDTFGQPDVNYVLTTFQSDQIADDINLLIADSARRHAIGQKALHRAQTVLNIEKALDQHAKIYHYWANKKRREKLKPKHS